MRYSIFVSVFFLVLSVNVFADDENTVPSNVEPAPTVQKPAPAAVTAKGVRSKSLSFDDSVVEGLNQNSKDSLEMIEKNGGKARQHLYQKKSDFKKIQNFPSELGYSP